MFVAQKIVDDSNSNEVYLDSDGNIVFKTHATMKIKPSILKSNTSYSFKLLVKSNSNAQNNIRFSINYTDGSTDSNVAETGLITDTNIRTLIFSSNSNKTIDYITAVFTYNAFATLIVDGSMILEGSYTAQTIPEYVPHQEQNYPFTFASGQFLADNEKLQENGMLKKWKKIVLNGTENFSKSSSNNIIYSDILPIAYKSKIKITNMLCSHFIYGGVANTSSTAYNYGNNTFSVNNSGSTDGRRYYFRNDNIETLEEWINFVTTQFNNGTPITLEVEFIEDYEELIPYNSTQASQYEDIKNAKTYPDETNISATSSELDPLLTLQYYTTEGGENVMRMAKEDLKKKIDERIEDEDLKIELLEDVEDSFDEVVEDTVERVEKTMYDELETKYDELKTKYKERFFKTEDETVTEEKEDETGLAEETVYEKEDIFEETKKEED